MSAHLLEQSITQLSEQLKTKKISPVEITKETLSQITRGNERLNAYITIMEKSALSAAKQAETDIQNGNYKGPLHGIPIGIKDLIHIKGVNTTFGSKILKDFIPTYDAEIITKLKKAGAIIIGKLNMHTFAYGPTGDRSDFGAVRNPHNLDKIPGGSSSGSGAAVASYQCYGAIGSDTGGSIRMPASMCGIVGMKPTFGRISKHGAFALAPTLDHLGPMTRTVKDNALLLNAIQGMDRKDPYSIEAPLEDFTLGIDHGIEGKTIGIPTSFYFDVIDPDVQAVFNYTVITMQRLGAKIEYIDIPGLHDLLTVYQIIHASEAFNQLEKYLKECPQQIEEEVRARAIAGMTIHAGDYIKMLQVRHTAINNHLRALEQVDVIMTPTLSALPANLQEREFIINGKEETARIYAFLPSLSNPIGFPAISVPAGKSPCGLPVGVQFMGKPLAEQQLYQFAYALEQTNAYQSNLQPLP